MPKQAIHPAKVDNHGNVRWRVIVPRDISSKRQVKFFETKDAAQLFADRLERSRASGDMVEFSKLTVGERSLVLNALRKAGDGNTLNAAVDSFLSQRLRGSVPLKDLIESCCESKKQTGYTPKHLMNMRSVLDRFAEGRESKSTSEITADEIESWLAGGKNWSANTRKNYLKDICTLFNFAIERRYIAINPAASISKPVVDHKRISTLTPEESKRLLEAAANDVSFKFSDKERKHPARATLLPYIACCLFLGLRPSEACKVKASDFTESGLVVMGKRTGTRRRRLVTLNPSFLSWVPAPVDVVYNRSAMRRIVKAAKFKKWHQDVMRHSFVSYHFAIHGAAATAREAGHSESVLFQHYREVVTREAAERFWGLRPRA